MFIRSGKKEKFMMRFYIYKHNIQPLFSPLDCRAELESLEVYQEPDSMSCLLRYYRLL